MKAYDVVICGGGVIGASIAYFLSRQKDLKIAVVDFKYPGNASRASAGGPVSYTHLTLPTSG